MALYYDLPVYWDSYQLTLKIFEYSKHLPREYKLSKGQDMKRDALQLVNVVTRRSDKERHPTFVINI